MSVLVIMATVNTYVLILMEVTVAHATMVTV